jgi:cell division transport system permease protein
MKLVGATNAFIRWPFIVEGLIQGSISWVLSLGLLLLVFNVVLPAWVPQLAFFVWPWENPFYLILIMLVLSLGMGWLGSNLAARRYIKETSVG